MAYLSLDEWNKKVDLFLENMNKISGTITRPGFGMYPPVQKGRIVSDMGINNVMVTKDLIRHYADATGDTNPLWRSEEYARGTRYGGIIAPPRILDCIAPTYGAVSFGPAGFSLEGMTPLNAGSRVSWYKTIHPGDEFTVFDKFIDIREVTKPEKPMPRLLLCRAQRHYINQKEELVAVSEGSVIVLANYPFDKDGQPLQQSVTPKPKHQFTPEEVQAFYDHYAEEPIRGGEVLFWEDVQEGEELPCLAKGPLMISDSLAFFGTVGYYLGFKTKEAMFQEYPSMRFVVDGGGSELVSMIHINDQVAQMQNIPCAIAFAAQIEAGIVQMICNWMGDDGFLKMLDCQARKMNPLGDASWLKGSVIRKYAEDGEHLVELKVWAENQDGVVHMPGTAVVRLLSRE